MGKKILLAFAVLLAIVGIGVASAGIWVLDVAASAPSIDSLKPIDSGANSEVFAADGTSLGYVQCDVIRDPVALKEVPKRLRNATIAIEDEHFYEHDGVDYSAVVRAAWENIEAGEVTQGGSTITQQLVRNLYIDDPEDTIERKIIEAEMAREYEEEYTKDGDPRGVPEHRLLRHQRRQDRDRGRGRLAGLLQQGRLGAQPRTRRRCSPACRRRPPTTTRSSTRRGEEAPQRGARRDGRAGLHQRRHRLPAERRPGSGSSAATATSRAPSSTSSTSSSRS